MCFHNTNSLDDMKYPYGNDSNIPAQGGDRTGEDFFPDDFEEQIEILPDPIRNNDFSEYMWMENEDEFNAQVLKELEEQELMEQCIEAMMDEDASPNSESKDSPAVANTSTSALLTNGNVAANEANGYHTPRRSSSANAPSGSSNRRSLQSRIDNIRANATNVDCNSVDLNASVNRLSLSDGAQGKSNLNPDAKEFVPHGN